MTHFLSLTYDQFSDRFDELLDLTTKLGEVRIQVRDCQRTVILKACANLHDPPITFTILRPC